MLICDIMDENGGPDYFFFIVTETGNFLAAVGRSKMNMIETDDNKPFFGDSYTFQYGKADIIRQGKDAAIIAMGGMLGRAIQAYETLKAMGYEVLVIGMACPSDPDVQAIKQAIDTGLMITYEDHSVHTGLGNVVVNVMAENGWIAKLHKLGVQR